MCIIDSLSENDLGEHRAKHESFKNDILVVFPIHFQAFLRAIQVSISYLRDRNDTELTNSTHSYTQNNAIAVIGPLGYYTFYNNALLAPLPWRILETPLASRHTTVAPPEHRELGGISLTQGVS